MHNKGDNDGLIQRFQLAVFPDSFGLWRNVDRWPDTAAKNRAYEVFIRLAQLEPDAVGARREENEPDGIPYLRFDSEAQAAFDALRNIWRNIASWFRRWRCSSIWPTAAKATGPIRP